MRCLIIFDALHVNIIKVESSAANTESTVIQVHECHCTQDERMRGGGQEKTG
jgi:hypothetical protein